MTQDRSPARRTSKFVAATITLAILGGVAFAQITPPTRRAGWWEITTTMTLGGQPRTIVQQMCTDPEIEKSYSVFSSAANAARASCSKRDLMQIPGGWKSISVCNFGNSGPRTSTSIVTGDFQSRVHMDMNSQGARGSDHMVMDMKWLGACPAGRRPGDVQMPGGMVFNVATGTQH